MDPEKEGIKMAVEFLSGSGNRISDKISFREISAAEKLRF